MASLGRSIGASGKLIAGFHPTGVVPAVPTAAVQKVFGKDEAAHLQTNDSLRTLALKSVNKGLYAKKTIALTTVRFAHTDVQFPNFDNYRLDSTKDPLKPALETEDDRRGAPNAIMYGVGGMLTLMAAKEVIQTLVVYKSMAADQRALAAIEIDLNSIPEGQTKTFEWRGKPVFVKHRTADEIKREKSVNVSDLRHPEHDDQRVQRDEWSVLIGVCTHLGCVPIAGSGDFGGYYCPCHGSHYDGSGRIRKGPAPLNLHIPAYTFTDDTTIVVGST